MPLQRGYSETSRSTPPDHHLLSLLHKRSHMTSNPSRIHSDWVKVLIFSNSEQCSVVSKRKRKEGRQEGVLYLLSLPPSAHKPSCRTVSQQARNKRGSCFVHLGDERNWAWQRKDPAPEKKKQL